MDEKSQPPRLKRYLSELSTLLVQERENNTESSNINTEDSFVDVRVLDISQNVFKKHTSLVESRHRKLQIHDDLVIIDKIPIINSDSSIVTHNTPNDNGNTNFSSNRPFDAPGIYLNDHNLSLFEDDTFPTVDADESPGKTREDQVTSSAAAKRAQATSSLAKPFHFSQKNFRKLIKPLLGQGSSKYTLPVQSMNEMKITIDELIAYIASELLAEIKNDGTASLTKDCMLKIFSEIGIVERNATNHDIFELCMKYLTLDDLNELEIALFS